MYDELKFILVVAGYLLVMLIGAVFVAVLSTTLTRHIFHISDKTRKAITEIIPKWLNGIIDEE